MKRSKCWWVVLATVWVLSGSMKSWAAGELHLSFHVGGSAKGSGFVGGTLLNSGDEPVAHSYLVVTLLDAKCNPVRSVMESFDSIAAGQTRSFRINVGADLKRYRLLSLKAFDSAGFEVVAMDDNEATLKAREAEERIYCARARSAATPASAPVQREGNGYHI